MKNIFFVGTAGCGKSTLVASYKNWLDERGIDSLVLNLDPGTDALPYVPDVDIREWVNTAEVMEEYGLGPNGAQVVAADLMAMNITKMTDAVNSMKSDYLLIDTPGQLELFSFRESSKVIVEAFGKGDSMMFYLSDPSLCKEANGFVTSMTLSALVQFRLNLPTFGILSKADTLGEEEMNRIKTWFSDPDSLYYALCESGDDSRTVVGSELFKAIENIGLFGEIRAVSAQDAVGLEELYGATQLCFFAGEDANVV